MTAPADAPTLEPLADSTGFRVRVRYGKSRSRFRIPTTDETLALKRAAVLVELGAMLGPPTPPGLSASLLTRAERGRAAHGVRHDRTGHKSTAMVAKYKREARTAAELDLGDWTPLDVALGLAKPSTPPKPGLSRDRGTDRKRFSQTVCKKGPGPGRDRRSGLALRLAVLGDAVGGRGARVWRGVVVGECDAMPMAGKWPGAGERA